MGLFNLSNSKKKKEKFLLQWQNIVIPKSGNKLIATEKQLTEITHSIATNDLRIINDYINIVEHTLKPDVFFMRLNLIIEKSKHLMALEKYISFTGASPSEAYNEVIENYQESIKQFLVRYFIDTLDKAEAMKTPKGKLGKYQKFYDSLQEYYRYMNDENIDYIETKYKAYTKK